MASSKNLLNLCFNAVYDKGKALVDRVGNSGEKGQQLQSTLHYLIRVFKLWSLPTIIQQYKNNEWKVCVQDLNNAADSITITLSLQSSTEFGRFEAFLRHLINNWFRGLNVKKLDNDYLSLLVTHPVPVLIHILPQKYTNGEELLPVSASSNVETVSRIIRHLLEDFCLCAQNESGRLSGDSKEKFQTKKTLKIKSDTDEYPAFQKREDDIFTSDFYHNSDTSSEVLLDQLKQAFASAVNASEKSQSEEKRVALEANPEVRRLKAENEKLKKRIEAWSYDKETETKALQVQVKELRENCDAMAMAVAQKDAEIQETLSELGRLSVELTRAENEKKRGELFTKTFKLHAAATQTSDFPEWSASSLDTRRSRGQATSSQISRTEDRSNEHEGHHGQESLNEAASLSDMPRTGVDASIYYNYKLLFLRIAGDLLNEDVLKLKRWVEAEFQIDTSGDVNAILLELDRKKIISVTDLSRLKKFFETNPRFDLVCLIDSYLCGDYGQLKKTSGALRASSRGANSQNALTSQRFARPPQWQSRAATRERYTGISHGQSRDIAPSGERKFPGLSRPQTREAQTGDGGGVSTQQTTHRPDAGSGLLSRKPRTVSLPQTSTSASRAKETVRSRNNTTQQRALVADGGTREQHEVQASGSDQSNTARNTTLGSNGQKLSKFQRPEDDDSQWLCSHYKRRCYVKFECCNKFWPCHRCHNNQSTCGKRKLKSRDTAQVKCVACNQEQPFAQFCSRCNAKFARYFCGLCKHLTGTDDKPYHCEKCGICRIHGDRSFHCDVCGVCLDVQLRGNHKCRAGSAHDECCICLEDAFTGCQILPCSHKVHKECATQMIRSGITRCPICRESFAHKLERRPFKKPP